eukprot:TRINITY_DN20784_c0_g1_i1.p1 TRINITY_DN20784_c0_g1~~TRINITY_DN20784_c0_g1_i1.p1  ORF type:complete len:210 (-),score=18.15 TRINITY_DN20784_c0_g1_i1:80-685(-)
MGAQSTCPQCGGSGELIHDTCPVCGGRKSYLSESTLSFYVPPGAPQDYVAFLPGEGHQAPGISKYGDVYVQVSSRPHDLFWRDGLNLHYNLTVSLKEALLGFSRKIEHLDGHLVEVKSTDIIHPASILEISDEGMPRRGWQPDFLSPASAPSLLVRQTSQWISRFLGRPTRGSLFVHFVVEFPQEHEIAEHRPQIAQLLSE